MMHCQIVDALEALAETEILSYHSFSGQRPGLIPFPSSIWFCYSTMEENGSKLMRHLHL